jgi:simple sugar transport system ATP-binding protein
MYDLLVAVHPTYGLDISAVEMIHRFLLEEQKRGASILLISEDLDEIFEIASTISVIFKGKLTPKRNRKDWSIEELGQNMMGLNLESVI